MSEEKKLNLFEKIQLVGDEIRNLEKGLTVGSGNYTYKAVGDLDVTLAVKDAEKKYRLVSIPIKQELVSSEVLKTIDKYNKEKIQFVDNIKMTLRIVDLEDAEKFIDIESFGKGIDSGDKGFGKASTYARKYALLNAYKIATGEDPDKDKSETIQQEPTDTKKDLVTNYLMKDQKGKESTLKHFNLGSIDDLNAEQIEIVYKKAHKEGRI
jgi:hypothetical protein